MSNLLNNNQNKKKLLNRGPKITPNEEFSIDNIKEEKNEVQPDDSKKKSSISNSQAITSIRVKKYTRNKVNALVQLGKAENADILINNMVEEYISNNLTKDEKKTYDIFFDVLRNKD